MREGGDGMGLGGVVWDDRGRRWDGLGWDGVVRDGIVCGMDSCGVNMSGMRWC